MTGHGLERIDSSELYWHQNLDWSGILLNDVSDRSQTQICMGEDS